MEELLGPFGCRVESPQDEGLENLWSAEDPHFSLTSIPSSVVILMKKTGYEKICLKTFYK